MGASVGMTTDNGGSVQAAHVVGSVRRPRIRACQECQEAALADFFSGDRALVKKVCFALPSRIVHVRQISLPLTNPEQIGRTVKFQAEKYLPGISPEDVIVDFIITRKAKSFTDLILLMVKKSDLEECFEPLRAAGIEAAALTVDFVALFNLVAMSGQFRAVSTTVVVHFSGEEILLLLVHEDVLLAIRRLPRGEESRLPARIAQEVAYSLTSAGVVGTGRIVLSGRMPESAVLDEINRHFDTEVFSFDPFSFLQNSAGKEAASLLSTSPVAAGAALQGLGKTPLAIDFLRGEARFQTPYEAVRKPLILTAVMVVAFIAVELISTMQAESDAVETHNRMVKHARSLFRKVVKGKRPKFSSTFHKTLEGLVKKRLASDAGEQGWRSFLDFLNTLTFHLPTDDRTVIHSVSFKGKKATLRGEADDVDSFEEIANALEKSGKFEVRTPFRMRGRRGKNNPRKPLSFTIELSPRRS